MLSFINGFDVKFVFFNFNPFVFKIKFGILWSKKLIKNIFFEKLSKKYSVTLQLSKTEKNFDNFLNSFSKSISNVWINSKKLKIEIIKR